MQKPFDIDNNFVKKASDKVLFYMFYNLPLSKQQIEASIALKQRGWRYNEQNMRW